MNRRRFLQYIGLGSILSLASLCKAGSFNDIPTVSKSNNHLFENRTNLNAYFTFDNYVVGKSNQRVIKAALKAAKILDGPLFLFGGVGLGKTHILHAIGNQALVANPLAHVTYVHSERLVADFNKSMINNTVDEFCAFYHTRDVLLIDDVHFISNQKQFQNTFYNILRVLINKGAQVVFAGDRNPFEMDGLSEHLKAAMGWRIIEGINILELETRVAIVDIKAKHVGGFPDGASLLIAKTYKSNIRELEGAVKRVLAKASFIGQPITLSLTVSVLAEMRLLLSELLRISNEHSRTGKPNNLLIRDFTPI